MVEQLPFKQMVPGSNPGGRTIISGIKAEKRIDEKTEEEIKKETTILNNIKSDLEEIKNKIDKIRKI